MGPSMNSMDLGVQTVDDEDEGIVPPATDALLLETGDYMLQETGDKILLDY